MRHTAVCGERVLVTLTQHNLLEARNKVSLQMLRKLPCALNGDAFSLHCLSIYYYFTLQTPVQCIKHPTNNSIKSKATQDALHAHIKRFPIDSVPGMSQCLQPMIAH